MQDRIETLRNLGSYTASRLAEIDILTVNDLRLVGPVEAYARLRFRFGKGITLNALWAIEAALAGGDWRQIPDERKRELKAELAEKG